MNFPAFLSEDQFADLWKDHFKEHAYRPEDRVTMYIHYPWCRSVCNYCVFGEYSRNSARDIIPEYEKYIPRAINSVSKTLYDIGVVPSELYFGGGTASLWSFEALWNIKRAIPFYDKIQCKHCEIHPVDITDNLINFYINEMKFDRISIGIQTFDENSLLEQNRIPGDPEKVVKAIQAFQEAGVFVNIDLVAMFNGDDPYNWNIFINDICYTGSVLKPDSIYISPNYKSDDYYGISINFRRIIQDFLDLYPDYHIDKPEALSLLYEDIIRYRDIPYTLKRNLKNDMTIHQFTKGLQEETVIGIGGFQDSNALSKTSSGLFASCKYLPYDQEFLYHVFQHPRNIDQEVKNEDLYTQTVQIGNYTIKPPKRRD